MFDNVSINGIIDPRVITLYGDTIVKADEGKVCKLSANATVSLCGDGDTITGLVNKAEKDSIVGVQISGVVTLPYTGTDPNVGIGYLVAGSSEGVKVDARRVQPMSLRFYP